MDNKQDILESMFDDIMEEMLEYHHDFARAGRLDLASVVANCLNMVQKRFNAEMESEEVDGQNNEH